MAGLRHLIATAFVLAGLAPLPALACADAQYLWDEQDLSLAELRDGIDFTPDEADARLALGAKLLKQGEWPEALYHLELAAAWEPDCAAAQLFYAYALNERAKPRVQSDLPDREHVLSGPSNPSDREALLVAVDRRLDLAAELESLDPFIHRFRGDTLLQRHLGYSGADSLNRALESYRKAVVLDPADHESVARLANFLTDMSAFFRGPACDEDYLRNRIGQRTQPPGDLEAAAPCFSEAADLLAGLYEAAISGTLDLKLRWYADAQEIGLGWFGSLILAERHNEAIGACRRIIEHFPQSVLAGKAAQVDGLSFEQAKAAGDHLSWPGMPIKEREAFLVLTNCAGT